MEIIPEVNFTPAVIPPDSSTAVASPEPKKVIERVLQAIGTITDIRWQQRILFLLGLRSALRCGVLRLPLYLLTNASTDIVPLRCVIQKLFQAGSFQEQPPKTTPESSFPCIMDLSNSDAVSVARAKQFAKKYSVPGTLCHYYRAESILIVSDESMNAIDPWGITLEVDKQADTFPSDSAITPLFEGWKELCDAYSAREKAINLYPADLTQHSHVAASIRRGFLVLATIARYADEISGDSSFSEAVKECWEIAAQHSTRTLMSSRKNAMLCHHILNQIKAHPGDEYREDELAKFITADDPEVFKSLNSLDLGKMLGRLNIGTVKRRGIEDGGNRVFHSFVSFSEADRRKMAQLKATVQDALYEL
jgi:hypothetical protein